MNHVSLDFTKQLLPRYDTLHTEITSGKLSSNADLSFVKTFYFLTKLVKQKKSHFSDNVTQTAETTDETSE